MTLDYITIQGFRSIASIEKLPIRPVNILIGANGSGKSNFLGAFSLLRDVAAGQLRSYVTKAGGAEKVLHFGSKTTGQIRLKVSFASEALRYDLELSPTHDDGLFPSSENVFNARGSTLRSPRSLPPAAPGGREAGVSEPREFAELRRVRDSLDHWRVYHLRDTSDSSPIRKTAPVHDNRCLKENGSNLPAFLYYLQQRHRSAYDLIRKTVQLAAPFFDDFRLEPLRLNKDSIMLEWRHKRNSNQYFNASSLSDGTLRFIALATLFLQPAEFRPSVMLVDEPELGLHPYAITLLASLIQQASTTSQVIISTQSPQLLDHFDPEDVLVADRVEGGTEITRPDAKRLKRWLERYTLGQLWDKNEIGGRPGPESR